LLRSIRKRAPSRQPVVISAADPLNLAGILTPGRRVAAITANRILLQDGVPIAALEAGEVMRLDPQSSEPASAIEPALRLGTMPAALRPYYA
jgi:ATP-dependent helicase Lhr and Lhr-like helicase